MAEPSPPLPSPLDARAMHAALLAGSRVASAALAEAYYEYLARWLWHTQRRAYPALDEQHCYDAAGSAIVGLLRNPAAYQPARAALDAYLRMSARGDLQNLLRAERRRQLHHVPLTAVEDASGAGNYLRDDSADPARIVERDEEAATTAEQVTALTAAAAEGLTAGEARALALLRQGERQTAAFAAALGIAHLPFGEQQATVKRVKDKLKKRLERAGGGR